MERLQLSPKSNLTDNIRKRRDKCSAKSLAVHAIRTQPSRPTISKQEAITISSTFTARPLPPLFYSYRLSFYLFFPSPFLILILFSSLFSFPWFTMVVDASIHQPLYVLMNVDLREECNTRVKDLWVCEVHLRCVSLQACFDVCVMYTEPCQG